MIVLYIRACTHECHVGVVGVRVVPFLHSLIALRTLHACMCVYVHVCTCMCVCVCVRGGGERGEDCMLHTLTHG